MVRTFRLHGTSGEAAIGIDCLSHHLLFLSCMHMCAGVCRRHTAQTCCNRHFCSILLTVGWGKFVCSVIQFCRQTSMPARHALDEWNRAFVEQASISRCMQSSLDYLSKPAVTICLACQLSSSSAQWITARLMLSHSPHLDLSEPRGKQEAESLASGMCPACLLR
jgi:hypothetical protein